MKVLENPQDVRKLCQSWRNDGLQIGFIATMGALHEGHLSLLRRAVAENDRTCASIFVNPLQFDDPDDLRSYPVNMEGDLELCKKHGCDMAFSGTMESFFPEADNPHMVKRIDPGGCASDLEGVYRPGFFDGVVTIVDRLFRIVGNCKAYFGEKDFQQTLVVRHLSHQLKDSNIEIEIVVCPTVRAKSGLALSSRNQRLETCDIIAANQIYRALKKTQRAWQCSVRDRKSLSRTLRITLEHPLISVDYAEVRNPDDWSSMANQMDAAIGLVAARVGGVRLIDSLRLDQPACKTLHLT